MQRPSHELQASIDHHSEAGYPALAAYTGLGEDVLRSAIDASDLLADRHRPVVTHRALEQWLAARLVRRLLADPEIFDQGVDLRADVDETA